MFNLVQHILLKHPISSYLLFPNLSNLGWKHPMLCSPREEQRKQWQVEEPWGSDEKSNTSVSPVLFSTLVNATQEEKCDEQGLQGAHLLCCCIWKGMCQGPAEGERMVSNSSDGKSSQRNRFFLSKFLCDPTQVVL